MALLQAAQRVAAEFDYPKEEVNRAVTEFLKQMDDGLANDGSTLPQIPSFVTSVPNGTEKGLYMAVDLGGTNFRVCSIQLHGNSTFSLTQSKTPVPHEIMTAKTYKVLFEFLAKQIEEFLKLHHAEHYAGHKERNDANSYVFSLGFTFSFPVVQTGINRGTLLRWTKGFDIDDAVGKDVCIMLQEELDRLGLPVKVAALINDTVGTLMARSYTSPGKTGTLLGAIFGTGTNGAYVEKLENIKKLKHKDGYDASAGQMVINSEWGSFDNTMHVLPNTKYDQAVDAITANKGVHMFEKRISGMFLGEITRRALLGMLEDPEIQLFKDTASDVNDLHSTTNIHAGSALYKAWGLDTSFLSVAAGDHSQGFRLTRQALDRDLEISAASAEDAEAVKAVAFAIGKRAARLAAVAIGAVVIKSGELDKPVVDPEADVIDVGVDGSLVEFYPNFEDHIREALREIDQLGAKGEQRIRIGIAKDGSGVGAALIALSAERALSGAPKPSS